MVCETLAIDIEITSESEFFEAHYVHPLPLGASTDAADAFARREILLVLLFDFSASV
jgi:hypothetical protein